MRVFYGAAIHGNRDRSRRHHLHRILIEKVKTSGCEVASEHTIGSGSEETASLLSKPLGPLPPVGLARSVFVRNRMIKLIESDISAASSKWPYLGWEPG